MMLGVELIMFESIFYIIIRQDGTSSLLRDRLLGISSFRFSLTMIGKQASIAPEPAQAAKNQKQFFTTRDNDLKKRKTTRYQKYTKMKKRSVQMWES